MIPAHLSDHGLVRLPEERSSLRDRLCERALGQRVLEVPLDGRDHRGDPARAVDDDDRHVVLIRLSLDRLREEQVQPRGTARGTAPLELRPLKGPARDEPDGALSIREPS